MKRSFFLLLVLILIGIGINSQDDRAFAATMEYSVKANLPENQLNKNLSYFDLKMSPGNKQTITITVSNTSDRKMELMIETNTATTNQNGVIDYSKADSKKDSSLKYAFSDLISPSQKVILEANETKTLPFTIKMPEKSLDGVILGGFYIYEVIQEDKKTSDKSVQINNEFSYVIGVKLTETNKLVTPELQLNKVKPELLNYRNAVTANLQNIKPVIINNLTVDARITKEGEKKVLHQTKKQSLSMAPNSNFDFPISWDNQEFEPGKYHLYITATAGKETWEFDKMFEIKDSAAEKLNLTAVKAKKDYSKIIIWSASVLAAVLLFTILLVKNKRKPKEED